MKPEEHERSDAALSKALREWEMPGTLPPRFGERVWQRIAREEAEAPAQAVRGVRTWLRRLGAARLRPALAVSCAVALVAGGLLAGYWQAHAENARTARELGSRYVHLMAAYERPAR